MPKNSFSQSVKSKFIKLDLLSSPVQLTVNGRSTYETITGAVLSLLMLVSILAYGTILILSESRTPYTFTSTTF
jgi:hypothetical protein